MIRGKDITASLGGSGITAGQIADQALLGRIKIGMFDGIRSFLSALFGPENMCARIFFAWSRPR